MVFRGFKGRRYSGADVDHEPTGRYNLATFVPYSFRKMGEWKVSIGSGLWPLDGRALQGGIVLPHLSPATLNSEISTLERRPSTAKKVQKVEIRVLNFRDMAPDMVSLSLVICFHRSSGKR